MDQFNDDRRRVRRSVATFGELLVEVDGATHPALVRDFSVCGMGLVAKRPFDAGTSLALKGGPNGEKLSTMISAEVRHAKMMPDGAWLLGCQLSRYLNADDVLTLGGRMSL